MLVLLAASLLFSSGVDAESRRLAMYWENWADYPKTDANYTHVIIAFWTSYNNNCQIGGIDASNVQKFKNDGKKVIGSFGGWDENKWWTYCTAQNTANQLVALAKQLGLNGVDIDYEESPVNTQYLIDLTTYLNQSLPAGSVITHAPMQVWLDNSTSPYWPVIQKVGSMIAWLNVQYYNNPPNPVTDPTTAITHYKNIVTGLFNGDATKVVFGFCIDECNRYNANASTAQSVTQQLVSAFPTNFGGVMAWACNSDDGSWSAAVHSALAQ
jgi:chitinase